MSTNNNKSAVNPSEKRKKSYRKPTLAVLGSVKQLTQTGSSTKADGTQMMR